MKESTFTPSRSFDFVSSALNARAVRQDMISSNIANVDTPFYRPRDIAFEAVLKKEADKTFGGAKEPKLQMAKTQNMHLEPSDMNSPPKPTMFFRDGHMARNDGNSVDLDVETSEMGKNSVVYNALVAALKKDALIFSSVIDASKNTQ